MGVDIRVKISAFCLQLADPSLESLARDAGQLEIYMRARTALESGTIEPTLEADLDALQAIVLAATGHGLYPTTQRGFGFLPGAARGHSAQIWVCPRAACAGRGRVRPGQHTPTCNASGEPLQPEQLAP